MTLKAVSKRMSIQVGSPLSVSPQKITENNKITNHPPPSKVHPELTGNGPPRKKRPTTSCTAANNNPKNKNPVLVLIDSQKKRTDNVSMDYLKEKDNLKIIRIKTHLNLINSFNLLINLSKLTLLSLNPPNILKAAQNQPDKQTGHLADVTDKDKDPNEQKRLEEDEAIEASFYHLALFRFELWLGRIADHLPQSLYNFKRSDQKFNGHFKKDDYEIQLTLDYLPPLDVLFVWYSYCLNSRNYYEDGLRLYPILKHLKFPLELAAVEYDLFRSSTNVEKLGPASQVSEQDAEALIKRIKKLSDPEHGRINLTDDKRFRNPSALSGLLSPKCLKSIAGSNARKLWISLTNTDFNLIDFINKPSFRTFICPQCDGTIESPFYVKDSQTNTVKVTDSCWSYSSPKTHKSPRKSTSTTAEDDQESIGGHQGNRSENPRAIIPPAGSHKNHAKLRCMICDWTGIKQDLSLYKFARELKFSSQNLCHKTTQDPVNCLAGTLTTLDDLNDIKNAIKFNILFLNEKNDSSNVNHDHGQKQVELVDNCLDHLKQIRRSLDLKILNNKLVPTHERFKLNNCFHNLLKSYAIPEPFSVDLIRSMKLETFFIEKMVNLGWTEINNPHSGTQRGKVSKTPLDGRLQSCLSRYNAFSSLASSINPLQVLIPTFDIDLAWKTDRLRGIEYTELMMQTNKNLISHPNELDLDKSKYLAHFRLTSALWISRYHIEYSRYPAPFVKIDRRQDWLKKATRVRILTPKSIPVNESPKQATSTREQSTASAARNQPPPSSLRASSIGISDNSQSLEHQKAGMGPPIVCSRKASSIPNKDELINSDKHEGQSDKNDQSQGHSVPENTGQDSKERTQVVENTGNNKLRDCGKMYPPTTSLEPEPTQPEARVDIECVRNPSEEIKNKHPSKGKQVVQPDEEDSDSSSVATKFSVESLLISESSPRPLQQIDQRVSQQYARKIYLEYKRPTPINAADLQSRVPLGSVAQSTNIQSGLSAHLNHPMIDETSQGRNQGKVGLSSQTNFCDRQPEPKSSRKGDGKPISSNTAHHPNLNLVASHATQNIPSATAPGLDSPSRHPVTPPEVGPLLTKCKFKVGELDDELFDNDFIIPIGKIAFVEEGNRLRCL